jgi:hypothetical protein
LRSIGASSGSGANSASHAGFANQNNTTAPTPLRIPNER